MASLLTSTQGSLRPWLGFAASAVLHAAPLSFPLQHLARQALPLRPSEAQVEVLHEVAAPEAAAPEAAAPEAASAPPAPAPRGSERAAALEPAVRRREAVRVAASAPPAPPVVSPSAVTPQPVTPALEPAVAAAPVAEAVALASAAEPGVAASSTARAAAPSVASTTIRAGTGTGPGWGSGAPGTGTGNAAGVAAAGADLTALRGRYLGQLRQRVLARREYPHLARRARLEGTVCLRISLDVAGRLAQVRSTCTAPAPLLEAALRAVREAAPFGPLPSGLGRELVLDLPMVFQLDAG